MVDYVFAAYPCVRCIFRSDNVGRMIRMTFGVYSSNAMFERGQLENRSGVSTGNVSLMSRVVATRLSVDGVPITDLSGYSVTTVFLPSMVSVCGHLWSMARQFDLS